MKRTIVNPIIKDEVTFVETVAESGGARSILEVTLMPGGGNALHYHKSYSETFTAIEGELGLKSGKDKTFTLQPGESFTVPPMGLHAFFNPGDTPIKFRVTIEPGHEGFENTLRIAYGMAADGLTDSRSTPKKLSHLALLVTMSDTNLPGFLSLILPILKLIANRARKRGEEQELIERYCR